MNFGTIFFLIKEFFREISTKFSNVIQELFDHMVNNEQFVHVMNKLLSPMGDVVHSKKLEFHDNCVTIGIALMAKLFKKFNYKWLSFWGLFSDLHNRIM